MKANKHSYGERRKLFARILALVLALLMLGGTAYYLIYMLMIAVGAEAPLYSAVAEDDLNIRVGLMYGDGVTESFETTTVNGYTVGVQPLQDGVYAYTPFWYISGNRVTAAIDKNLTYQNGTYSAAKNADPVYVGGYHIEFITDYAVTDMTAAEQMRQNLDAVLSPSGMYSFPVYKDGVIRLRVGSFSTEAAAAEVYPYVAGIMNYFAAEIAAPSETAITLLDSETGRILMEYDSSDGTSLGLSATDSAASGNVYIKTPVQNVYDGVMAYTRYTEEGMDGVAVTNVLTLDQYVEGVLPYEISSTWPMETLKAFSIAARSYAAYTLGRHDSAYHFDLCNGGHCQLYRGAGRVDQNVKDAVKSTHGLIITYQGEIASTYYSSSCGGNTVSIGDVWGGASSPYLIAHETPWERYSEHTNGFWTVEISPTELLNYLREQKGLTQLKGYIASISVLEYAPNSTYVKKLRFTDAYGNSVDIVNTDKVRSTLGAYLKSANFVVGQGSVTYTLDTVQVVGERIIDNKTQKHVLAPVDAGTASLVSSGLFVQSADALESIPNDSALILTGNGTVSPGDAPLYVQAATGELTYLGKSDITSVPASEIQLPRTIQEYTVVTETKTASASAQSNFIFVGKGWGHGAGMSQYGAKDLADLGYDYEHIINAYFTDVEIVHYKTIPALDR